MLGITLFFFLGIPFYLIAAQSSRMIWAPLTWADHVRDDIFYLVIAVSVGAAVGLLLHAFGQGDIDGRSPSLPHQSCTRSDVLGGTVAAFLALGGRFVTLPLGLFSRPVNIPADWMHQLAAAPQLPSAVLIGTVALLPHLLMVGVDLRDRPDLF